MSKNEKAKTKNVHNIARPVNSVRTTKNTTEQVNVLPKVLSKRGCQLLAIAVIKSAARESLDTNNYDFFDSPMFHFYAGLAFGGKEDYRSGTDIIADILNSNLNVDQRCGNGRQRSKYS